MRQAECHFHMPGNEANGLLPNADAWNQAILRPKRNRPCGHGTNFRDGGRRYEGT